MAMHRIRCPFCGWKTRPHYLGTDCVREKENAHKLSGIRSKNSVTGITEDAHDSAFSDVCPKCGKDVKYEYRWFSDSEIRGDAK